eukprot:Clim_evm73s88 gene=Clim_evmTU73s88
MSYFAALRQKSQNTTLAPAGEDELEKLLRCGGRSPNPVRTVGSSQDEHNSTGLSESFMVVPTRSRTLNIDLALEDLLNRSIESGRTGTELEYEKTSPATSGSSLAALSSFLNYERPNSTHAAGRPTPAAITSTVQPGTRPQGFPTDVHAISPSRLDGSCGSCGSDTKSLGRSVDWSRTRKIDVPRCPIRPKSACASTGCPTPIGRPTVISPVRSPATPDTYQSTSPNRVYIAKDFTEEEIDRPQSRSKTSSPGRIAAVQPRSPSPHAMAKLAAPTKACAESKEEKLKRQDRKNLKDKIRLGLVQIRNCERELNRTLGSDGTSRRGMLPTDVAEGLKFRWERTIFEYGEEEKRLKGELGSARKKLEDVFRLLRAVRPGDEDIPGKVRTLLEEVEKSVMAIRHTQRRAYDGLLENESRLQGDLAMFEQQMLKWDTAAERLFQEPPNKAKSHARNTSKSLCHKGLPPEIIQFEDYLLEHGGHTGGWNEGDHLLFLKFRKPLMSNAWSPDQVVKKMQGRPYDEVMQHEQWYAEYLALRDQKKGAIHQWRKRREAEKARVVGDSDDTPRGTTPAHLKKKTPDSMSKAERQEKKAKLRAWRLKKQKEKEAREEVAKIKTEQEKHERMIKSKRREQQKAELKRFWESQQSLVDETSSRVSSARSTPRKHVSAEDLARLATRDLERARKQREAKEMKLQAEREKAERLKAATATLKPVVAADRSRLLKATKASENKNAADLSEAGTYQQIGFHASLPRRAVPTWRKGL